MAVLLGAPFVNASMRVGLRLPFDGLILASAIPKRPVFIENVDLSDDTNTRQLYAKNGVLIGARLQLLLKSTKHNKCHIARVEYGEQRQAVAVLRTKTRRESFRRTP